MIDAIMLTVFENVETDNDIKSKIMNPADENTSRRFEKIDNALQIFETAPIFDAFIVLFAKNEQASVQNGQQNTDNADGILLGERRIREEN